MRAAFGVDRRGAAAKPQPDNGACQLPAKLGGDQRAVCHLLPVWRLAPAHRAGPREVQFQAQGTGQPVSGRFLNNRTARPDKKVIIFIELKSSVTEPISVTELF